MMRWIFVALFSAAASKQCEDNEGNQCASSTDDVFSHETAEAQRSELLQRVSQLSELNRAGEDQQQTAFDWWEVSDTQRCKGSILKTIPNAATPIDCLKKCQKTKKCMSASRGREVKGEGTWQCVLFTSECKSLVKKGQGEWKSYTTAPRPGCSNPKANHGEYQSRVRFKKATVQFPEACKEQTQQRPCDMGTWKEWSGKFTEKACEVITPAPTSQPTPAPTSQPTPAPTSQPTLPLDPNAPRYISVPYLSFPQDAYVGSYCPSGTTYSRHVCGSGAGDWTGDQTVQHGPFNTNDHLDEVYMGFCYKSCNCNNITVECQP